MKKSVKFLGIIALAAVIGLLAACNNGSTTDNNISPTGITLNPPSLTLAVGSTGALTAVVLPANATNKSVNWTSTHPGVAIVSSNGTVNALSLGLAIIVATTVDGGHAATCAVSVIEGSGGGDVPPTGVSLTPPTLSLEAGETRVLTATVQPTNATNKDVNWDSSNHAVAEVDTDGNVTAKGPGMATIYVSTVEGGHSASAVITVNASKPTVPSEPSIKYVAIPYTGGNITARAATLTDSIKYSYTYGDYDIYYIYLGELKNIPLFFHTAQRHTGLVSTYEVTISDAVTNSVSKAVENSSQTTIGVVEAHTKSTTTGLKLNQEISFGKNESIVKAKFAAEESWSWYTSDTTTNSFQETTSLKNTVTEGTQRTETSLVSRKFPLDQSYKPGYYRYTLFSASDVYLYVIKDSTGKAYYEFREHIIPASTNTSRNFWDLDYSETEYFGKTDTSHFEFDVSQLDNLPKPKLILTPPPEPKRMEYSVAGTYTYTLDAGFPATIEIYALGAGGGGQGGHSKDRGMAGLFENRPNGVFNGTGGAGGGGAAAYIKFTVTGPVTFKIDVGKGGSGTSGVYETYLGSWKESALRGGNGGRTLISWDGGVRNFTVDGGEGGGGSGTVTTGGSSGKNITWPSIVYEGRFPVQGTTNPGTNGSRGNGIDDQYGNEHSTGGNGASVSGGSLGSFGGGSGGIRPISGISTSPANGGGGYGGYTQHQSGSDGGNGLAVIVVTY